MEENAKKCILSAPILIPLHVKLCMMSVFMCFYQNLVLVAKYHVDRWQTMQWHCCDEFPVPQIDRKSKQVKEQWNRKFY